MCDYSEMSESASHINSTNELIINVSMLSNAPIKEDTIYDKSVTLDTIKLNISTFISQFYNWTTFAPNSTPFNTLTINKKEFDVVSQIQDAYQRKNCIEASTLQTINVIQEFSTYLKMNTLNYCTSLSRVNMTDTIRRYPDANGFTANISMIFYSRVLDVSVLVILPCNITLSISQEIEALSLMLLIKFLPKWESYSDTDQTKKNLILCLFGDKETIKKDIEDSALPLDEKTTYTDAIQRVTRLRDNTISQFVEEPDKTQAKMLVESINKAAENVHLLGIGDKNLGTHQLALITVEDAIHLGNAKYGRLWVVGNIIAFGAAADYDDAKLAKTDSSTTETIKKCGTGVQEGDEATDDVAYENEDDGVGETFAATACTYGVLGKPKAVQRALTFVGNKGTDVATTVAKRSIVNHLFHGEW